MEYPNGFDVPGISSGSVYISFMLKVEKASPSGSAFLNVCPFMTVTNTNAVYLRDTLGGIVIGLAKSSGVPVYSPAIYLKGHTYLIVVKYTFVPGISNDSASLFVLNNSVPANEPPPQVRITSDSDIGSLGMVYMLQNETHRAIIDGIDYRGSWISDPPTKLNVKAIIEGYYNPTLDLMNTKDFIKVYLRRAVSPFDIVDEGNAVIDSSTFEVKYNLHNTPTGYYYVILDHKNGLETWSKVGGEYIIRGSTYDYDFTNSASQAYGNNLTRVGTKYCVYSGDVLHDGLIDLYDVIDISNLASYFTPGNTIWDLNGDKNVDLTDVIIASNNSFKFIGVINP